MKRNAVLCIITCPDITQAYRIAVKCNAKLYEVTPIDSITYRCVICGNTSQPFITALEKAGYTVQVLRDLRYFKLMKRLCRPVLFLGIILLIFLTFWIPERVLFISVEGNSTISSVSILQAAEAYGIHFGIDRQSIRSEPFKNYMLKVFPELSWAAVNTSGCIATITVKEAETGNKQLDNIAFSHVVATRDGVVISATTTSGNQMFEIGDAVKEGQILISGLTNQSGFPETTRASGEIFALTSRKIAVITPSDAAFKGRCKKQINQYSLNIGKKRIFLSKDSRIPFTECDRLYKEIYTVLPGGYILPLSFIKEEITVYQTAQQSIPEDIRCELLLNAMDQYIISQMNAGKIVQRIKTPITQKGVHAVAAQYYCIEMIGRETTEEIRIDDG